MHKNGHVGAALIFYSPLFFWLLASGQHGASLIGLVTTIVLAPLPDIDLRIPGLPHRGPTHTVAFWLGTIALAAVGGFLGGLSQPVLWTVVASVAIAVGSHILVDATTPMGVGPLWPLSPYRARLPPGWRSGSIAANAGLSLAGVAVTVLVFTQFVDAIVTSALSGVGVAPEGSLNTPQSPEEWRTLSTAALDSSTDTMLAVLRYDHIGGVVVAVTILVGLVVLSKS